MSANDDESVRFRIGPALKKRWEAVTDAHKISQQQAAAALLEWFVSQDPMLRTMVLGQVPDVDPADLARLAIKRLATDDKAKGGKA